MNDQISLMMKICLMLSATIISGLLDFTVLKQYVHHVVLLLHGQSSLNLNHLPRFWPFWKKYFTQKNQNQITFALIKHAMYLKQPSEMDLGTECGKRQQDLLLILIIISTIMIQMNFVKNGVTLHQLMVLPLIWLSKEKTNKAKCALDVPLIHK